MPQVLKITLNVIIMAIPIAFLILAASRLRHLFRGEEDPGKRAILAKRAGLAVMGAFASFVGAFAIGEPLADPGGWLGVGMVASWLVPLVLIGLVVRFKPSVAQVLLAILTAAAVAFSLWAMFDQRIRDLEDRNGPFTMVVLLVVAIAVAALGYYRPKPAAIMLLVCALVPALFATISPLDAGPGAVLYAIVGLPMVVTAVLYLASQRISSRGAGSRFSGGGNLGRPTSA